MSVSLSYADVLKLWIILAVTLLGNKIYAGEFWERPMQKCKSAIMNHVMQFWNDIHTSKNFLKCTVMVFNENLQMCSWTEGYSRCKNSVHCSAEYIWYTSYAEFVLRSVTNKMWGGKKSFSAAEPLNLNGHCSKNCGGSLDSLSHPPLERKWSKPLIQVVKG